MVGCSCAAVECYSSIVVDMHGMESGVNVYIVWIHDIPAHN